MGFRGWRIIARDRDASKLKETKVLHGPRVSGEVAKWWTL